MDSWSLREGLPAEENLRCSFVGKTGVSSVEVLSWWTVHVPATCCSSMEVQPVRSSDQDTRVHSVRSSERETLSLNSVSSLHADRQTDRQAIYPHLSDYK